MASSLLSRETITSPALPFFPPGQLLATSETSNEAPAHPDRSFLIDRSSGLKFTPTDELTYVPYPIVTTRPLPAIGRSVDANGVVVADWNHAFHPRERLTTGGKTELGLRNSRTEWVHRDDHNAYHREFVGPDLASCPDLLAPMIFSAASFIPDRGLHYDGAKRAEVVPLSTEYREYLWTSGRIRVPNVASVRDALVERALENDFGGIKEATIDEFLSTADRSRRLELGSTLLSLALHETTAPLRDAYRLSYRNHQLPPNTARTVGKFTMHIIKRSGQVRAINALDTRLRAVA